ENLIDEPLALHAVEQRVFGIAKVLDDPPDVAPQRVAGKVLDAGEVELLHELGMYVPLEVFKALVAGRAAVRRIAARRQAKARALIAVAQAGQPLLKSRHDAISLVSVRYRPTSLFKKLPDVLGDSATSALPERAWPRP